MASTTEHSLVPPVVQPPRPYPYGRPIPAPPLPQELAQPIACYKCRHPDEPLAFPGSPALVQAENYYKNILTSTWRSQIDRIEAHSLANELERQGLLQNWVEHVLEETGDTEHVKTISTQSVVDQSREGLKEAVRIVASKEKMTTRMERVLKRTMESVLIRMYAVGFSAQCFHDIIGSSQPSVPIYNPSIPPPINTAETFASTILRSITSNRLPNLARRVKKELSLPNDLTTILVEAYPLWRTLLIESCKREHHKSMYDVQLMMVGGYSMKLVELAWRELQIDKRFGQTIESLQTVGFARVVKWCEMGGVRIALWEKGEIERIEKEKQKLAQWEMDESKRVKAAEEQEKLERKKRERTERRRKRDSERFEVILTRLNQIEKERKFLLEESLALEAERSQLELKLASHWAQEPSVGGDLQQQELSRAASPLVPVDESPSADAPIPATLPNGIHTDANTATDTVTNDVTTVDTVVESATAKAKATDEAVAAAGAALAKAEERLKVAERIERVFHRMIANPAQPLPEIPYEPPAAQPKPAAEIPIKITLPPPAGRLERAKGEEGKFYTSTPVLRSITIPINGDATTNVPPQEPTDTEPYAAIAHDFVQGSSKDWPESTSSAVAVIDPFSVQAPRADTSANKGKSKASELEACTCGYDSRSSSPARKTRKTRKLVNGTNSAGHNEIYATPNQNELENGQHQITDLPPSEVVVTHLQNATAKASLPIVSPAKILDQIPIPHVCPTEIHTPDPANPTAPIPYEISPDLDDMLYRCFLAAYIDALVLVNEQQLVQTFQTSTASFLSQIWQKGGNVHSFLAGDEQELRAVEFVINEIFMFTTAKSFHDRVAQKALQIAFKSVIEEIFIELQKIIPSLDKVPCLCLISMYPDCLSARLHRDRGPTCRGQALPFYTESACADVRPIYEHLLSTGAIDSSTVTIDDLLQAHVQCFDMFHQRVANLDPGNFPSTKHVTKVLSNQGGVAAYLMAAAQDRAVQWHEPSERWPIRVWQHAVHDAGVRLEEQLFRKENSFKQFEQIRRKVSSEAYDSTPTNLTFDLSLAGVLQPQDSYAAYLRGESRLAFQTRFQFTEAIYDCSLSLALVADQGANKKAGSAYATTRYTMAKAFAGLGRYRDALNMLDQLSGSWRPKEIKEMKNRLIGVLAEFLAAGDSMVSSLMIPEPIRGKIGCAPHACTQPVHEDNDAEQYIELFELLVEFFISRLYVNAMEAFHGVIRDLVREQSSIISDLFSKDPPEKGSTAEDRREMYREGNSDMINNENLVGPVGGARAEGILTATGQDVKQRLRSFVGVDTFCLCTLNTDRVLDLLHAGITEADTLRNVWSPKSIPTKTFTDDWLQIGLVYSAAPGMGIGILEEVYSHLLADIRVNAETFVEAVEKADLDYTKPLGNLPSVLDRIGGARIWAVLSQIEDGHEIQASRVENIEYTAWLNLAKLPGKLSAEQEEVFATSYEARADKAAHADQYQKAFEDLSTALAARPNERRFLKRAKLGLKFADNDAQFYKFGLNDCTQALQLAPTQANIWLTRAEILLYLGFTDLATSDLEMAILFDPALESIESLITKIQATRFLQSQQSNAAETQINYTALVGVRPFETSKRIVHTRQIGPAPGVGSAEKSAETPATNSANQMTNNNSTAVGENSGALVKCNGIVSTGNGLTSAVVPSPTNFSPSSIPYLLDPRLACPPIRCTGAIPSTKYLDELDRELLDIFLLAYKIELADRRPANFALIRDTLIRQYLLTPGWEKNFEGTEAKLKMEKLSLNMLETGYATGTSRADRGLEFWLNGVLLAVKTLSAIKSNSTVAPVNGNLTTAGGASRDCCICLLSSEIEHVRSVRQALQQRVVQIVDEPSRLTLPKTDVGGLQNYCRAQIKLGTLPKNGIWRSAPKWRFQVEQISTIFEQVFESVARKFNYQQFEIDYPEIAKFVGGISTFESAHRLLLHPDPPEPGSKTRTPLAVEDVMGWAAFVSANAPFPNNSLLGSGAGDVNSIGCATAKVDEATKCFREGKYLESIRLYSIAAIWASDVSGQEMGERAKLRNEARRTLKSGIYSQLSYLRTLFPSSRQWMSAVADATLAIACSQKTELPAALDLRSTALHGIRQYKMALSDLEDAALLAPDKARVWQDRLDEMRNLVPKKEILTSSWNHKVKKLSLMAARNSSQGE